MTGIDATLRPDAPGCHGGRGMAPGPTCYSCPPNHRLVMGTTSATRPRCEPTASSPPPQTGDRSCVGMFMGPRCWPWWMWGIAAVAVGGAGYGIWRLAQ